MKHNKQIEEQAEAALTSLDGLQPVHANPFLYTRIEQRLQNKTKAEYDSIKMFCLALLLLVFIGVNLFTYEKLNIQKNADNTKMGIETFARDYDLQQSDDTI